MSARSPRACWVLVLALGAGFAPAVRAEAPTSAPYPFPNPPLEIYERFAKAGLVKTEPLADAERKFLADFWAARTAKPARNIPPADDAAVTAHLIASGVSDPTARAAYLKKFNELVEEARTATANSQTEPEKADRLLRFLHKGVMAKGYEARHTTIPEAFDTGKFNCVSSSCLYFLVGTRLGLTLRPVLVPGTGALPGHAAVDLITGLVRVEIEPTNPSGYDWPSKVKQPNVIVLGVRTDRKNGFDTDGFGLASSIASNRCTWAGKERPAEAVRSGVISLILAPTDPLAANNLIAAVGGWGVRLIKEEKFEDALAVFAFARGALGPVKEIEHNYAITWSLYLEAEFGAGRVRDGLKLLPRAAGAFPKDKRFAAAGEWLHRAAWRKAEKDGYTVAMKFADTLTKELSGDDAKVMRAWKDAARRVWSQGLLDKGDVAGSHAVIAAGLAESPDSKELAEGLSYHAQTALTQLDAKKGTAAAVAHFKELTAAHPRAKEVRDAGYAVAYRAVAKHIGDKKFEDALKAVGPYEPLAGDRADGLREHVYDRWGRALAAGGEWEAALKKYAEGLSAYPKSAQLRDGVVAVADQWAFKAIDKKDWAVAVERYDAGLKLIPDAPKLKDNRAYCAGQRDKK